jgi:magnesium-transporting ATPase (P-type)
MDRPPRGITDRVIDRRMWGTIFWIGGLMALVTLGALDLRLEGGLIPGSGGIVEARTMAFTTLVLAQLFNCFCARSDRQSAFRNLFTNPLLWAAVAVSIALQVAVVELPFLNRAFGTTPMPATDWIICTALASVVLWGDELRKLLLRRLRA